MFIPTHGYRVWCRRNELDALWTPMPYAPRDSAEAAQHLADNYAEEWGNLYEYEVHRGGICPTYPRGTRIPCFPGIND